MSRRKSQPTKRLAPSSEEQKYNHAHHTTALAHIPPSPSHLTYPDFQTFYMQVMAHYTLGSTNIIPELEAISPRAKMANAPISNQQFATMLCHWTLYYKSDLQRFSRELIAFINAGARLNELGLRVDPSNIPGAGNGLFATRGFNANQFITQYGGYYATADFFEILDLPAEAATREYLITIPPEHGGGIRDALVGFRLCDMGRWSNHTSADKANVYTEVIPNSHPPAFQLVTLREIQAGEELVWDYGNKMQFGSIQCSICERLSALSMCSACEMPICGRVCQLDHVCE